MSTEDIEVLADAMQRPNTIVQSVRVFQPNEQSFVAESVAQREGEYGGACWSAGLRWVTVVEGPVLKYPPSVRFSLLRDRAVRGNCVGAP